MRQYLDQGIHNAEFRRCIDQHYPNRFTDWKITVTFYEAHHYLRALAANKHINIGKTHSEIHAQVDPNRPNARMPISRSAWNSYSRMFRYAQISRYQGMTDRSTFETLLSSYYAHQLSDLELFKKYVTGKGASIPGAKRSKL